MKKITLLLFVALLSSFTAMAQFTFPTDPAVYTVPDNATTVPVAVNDAANAAAVPAGTYITYTVTADWSIPSGNAWSSEARLAITTAAGTTVAIAPTAGGADTTAATMLTFEGTLFGPYDPSVDGLLTLGLSRTFSSPGDWTNIVVTITEAPSVVPGCATNMVSTPDVACGNFDTVLTWDAIAEADGYNLTIGTTSGGIDILDNQDIGDVLTYTVPMQVVGTDYFWTVTPYNLVGPAMGCMENTYTTFATGCYCTSVPSSNDGTGVSNLQVSTTGFVSGGDITYEDFTALPAVDLGQGANANVQVTFATGFTYATNIWIDLNDDLTFDGTELLYTGESLDTNPTTLDATFLMPATAALGMHRMRIGTADTGQFTPDPCYNGTFGVTMDLNVNIIVLTCTPPTATTIIVPDCANSQYFIDVDVTGLGDGTSVINDGTTTYPATTLGVVQVGPYADGASVTLTLENGTDMTCDTSLGMLTFTCPPANDNLCDAIALTVGATSSGDAYTNVASTAEVGEVVGSCFNEGISSSVWFSFVATAADMIVSTDINTPVAPTLIDSELAVYSSDTDCTGTLTEVGCDQDGGTAVNFNSVVNLTALTIGTTYYIQVDRWGTAIDGTFGIEVTVSPPANDECANAEVLTLGTMVSGDTTNATDSGIAAGTCGAAGGDQDVWYSFVGPVSTAVTITTTADHCVIYDLCGGTEVACLSNGEEATGLIAGTTYYARVYNSGTALTVAGPFTITLTESSLSTTDFNNVSLFSYYPNPVKNTLTLNAQKEIANVTIFNMLGQTVLRAAPNTVSSDVDMSNFQAGAYFLQVTVGDAVETVKIIKK